MSSINRLNSPGVLYGQAPIDETAQTSHVEGVPEDPHSRNNQADANALGSAVADFSGDLPSHSEQPISRGPDRPLPPTYSASVQGAERTLYSTPSAPSLAASRNPFRQLRNQRSLRSLASNSSSLALNEQRGDTSIPPVPSLPPAFRQEATAGTSTGPDTAQAPSKSIFQFSKTQNDRDHDLREALKKGDDARALKKLSKAANPAAPSSKANHNSFHIFAEREHFPSNDLAESMLTTDRLSLGQAAIKQDKNGNTPIHLLQYKIGFLSHERDSQPRGSNRAETDSKLRTFRRMRDALTQATPENVNAIKNKEDKTPQEMRDKGNRDRQRAVEQDNRLRQDIERRL